MGNGTDAVSAGRPITSRSRCLGPVARTWRTITPGGNRLPLQTVDGDVLAVLARADAAFTAPRVQELIGQHSVPGVPKVLNRLAGQGIFDADRVERTIADRLNRGWHRCGPATTLGYSRAPPTTSIGNRPSGR